MRHELQRSLDSVRAPAIGLKGIADVVERGMRVAWPERHDHDVVDRASASTMLPTRFAPAKVSGGRTG